ncbi:putative PLC-like phosphodiesterase, TIM beta/alpha-barrel domain superfamily [Helianthus anomalus]
MTRIYRIQFRRCGCGYHGIVSQANCTVGLYCGNFPQLGKIQPFCIRGQANIPTAIIYGLPFNKYTWLVTHNAFSTLDARLLTGPQRITFNNQEDSVTNHIRVYLCPTINTSREVEAVLSSNPTEIVTIIIEDYVHTTKGLTKLFTDAGLDKYWFPVSKMPKKGEDLPTVTHMARDNHRLLVFTSYSSKEATEGIAYQWRYMVENESGDPGIKQGSCSNRKESQPLLSKVASLFLQNYFPTIPVQAESCKENSAPLADMVATCYKAAGNTMDNFLAVNFYMARAPFGTCRNYAVCNSTSPTNPTRSFSGNLHRPPVHHNRPTSVDLQSTTIFFSTESPIVATTVRSHHDYSACAYPAARVRKCGMMVMVLVVLLGMFRMVI